MSVATPRTIAEVVAWADSTKLHGTPNAAKRGRYADLPYVPVIVFTDEVGARRTEQIKRLAFATREEAVAAAEDYVRRARERFEATLRDEQRGRAAREHYGVQGQGRS